jgi:hypothetical protein
MIDNPPAWLFQDVPLYAFLLALLTSPWRWSQYARRVIDRVTGGSPDE